MQGDLGWPEAQVAESCAAAGDSSATWVELAHTPQIPHLGIVRMILCGARAAQGQNGVFLYCVNDHLPVSLLAESRYLPLSNAQGRIAKPPQFGPGKRNSDRAMSLLPAPNRVTLDRFSERWRVLSEREEPLPADAMEVLFRAGEEAQSFAGWLSRVTFDLLGLTPLILPTSRLGDACPDEIDTLMGEAQSCGWRHCVHCGKRLCRWPAPADCRACGDENTVFRPDVRGRQAAVNSAALALRICGRTKPYQRDADILSRTVLEFPAPKRRHITGTARLIAGFAVERPNLLQALQRVSAKDRAEFEPPNDDAADWIVGE